MKIYSMTATFGKLSHETIRLEPGLNIIEAPNEWGKSTWCAFLVAMLYGIDTRQQTTKTALADKERYAPWSGEPMSGRMELNWNGRDITIERSTKGRVPFGEFRAYETATGIEVPELTAAKCGQTLLGVERSVFTRAGFIRLTDMPVTHDDTLRRRLNALVTTGDESDAGDKLGKQLRELKNKCRYNRSGLLPQAEYEQEQLRGQLQQRQELQEQSALLKSRRGKLEAEIRLLENHTDALKYEAAKQGARKIQEAKEALCRIQEELQAQEASCASLPSLEETEKKLEKGQLLLQQQRQLLLQQQSLPQPPVPPETPKPFAGLIPAQALSNATDDFAKQKALETAKKSRARLPWFYCAAALAVLTVLLSCRFALGVTSPLPFIIGGGVICLSGIALLIVMASKAKLHWVQMDELYQKYPGISPDGWVPLAQQYEKAQSRYALELEQYNLVCGDYQEKLAQLTRDTEAYAGESTLEEQVQAQEQILQQHRSLTQKRREKENAAEHYEALRSVATAAPEPTLPDTLTYSAAETEDLLNNARFEQRQLQLKLGQAIGQAEAIGQESVLKARLDSVSRRIDRLEEYYRALELAQEALYQATTALQRRFAPRINKTAQDCFSRLTAGRYSKISLSDDFSISASAENENILRGVQWRSDGTADQLYFALRLAVAGELTPDAPLILDDALLRFDDTRLKAALDTLQEAAGEKQVLLFTCQSRENQMLKQ